MTISAKSSEHVFGSWHPPRFIPEAGRLPREAPRVYIAVTRMCTGAHDITCIQADMIVFGPLEPCDRSLWGCTKCTAVQPTAVQAPQEGATVRCVACDAPVHPL